MYRKYKEAPKFANVEQACQRAARHAERLPPDVIQSLVHNPTCSACITLDRTTKGHIRVKPERPLRTYAHARTFFIVSRAALAFARSARSVSDVETYHCHRLRCSSAKCPLYQLYLIVGNNDEKTLLGKRIYLFPMLSGYWSRIMRIHSFARSFVSLLVCLFVCLPG